MSPDPFDGVLSCSSLFRARVTPPRPQWFEALVDLMVNGPGEPDRLRPAIGYG